jgi:hypothetical protein
MPAGNALRELQRFAARDELPVNGITATIAWLAGISGPLPAAALSWLAATGMPPREPVTRIDPVNLMPDADGLRLLPAAALGLDDPDSATLAAYLANGHQLPVTRAGAWSWIAPGVPGGLSLAPVYEVSGLQIGSYLPAGAERMRMRSWLNEAQMILHECPVNRRRIDTGQPTINSVWPWGQGELPAELDWSFTHAYADEPAVAGIAQLAGTSAREGLQAYDEMDDAPDAFAWVDEATEVESRWLVPAIDALHSRQLDELVVLDGSGMRWTLRRTLLWRLRRMLK